MDKRTLDLLDHLHRGGGWCYTWTMPDKRTRWYPAGHLETPPADVDTYFNVHPVNEIPEHGEPGAIRARIEDIAGINCFYSEFDIKDFADEADCKAHIQDLQPTPSAIVASGGGWHAYWLLDEYHPIDSDEERERIRQLQAQWVTRVGGDAGAKDLARVLRLPGTFNHKYDLPRPVLLKHPRDSQPFVTYTFDHLAKLASSIVKFQTLDATTSTDVAYIPQGTRNATLTSIAGSMRRRGLEPDEIFAGIWQVNVNRCQPPLSEDEIHAIAGSMSKYQPTLAATEVPIAPTNPKSADYIAALRALGYDFRLNEMNDEVECNLSPISDPLRSLIRSQLRDFGYAKVQIAEDAWIAEAFTNRYHPIRDYLKALTWDETDHIYDLAEFFEDTHGKFYQWLKRWMIGAVARVMLPGVQNRMLILDGPQNVGKSYFARWLCPLPQYYVEGPIQPDNKDDHVRLISSWVWEVAELGSTIRRADREALKFFISQETVTVRRPYGRNDMKKPATASFIGTLNSEGGFLSDPTGSRRFMATTVRHIDWAYAEAINVDQVWATAYALYQLGEPWNLTREEMQEADDINATYEIEDPVMDYILQDYVVEPENLDAFVATTTVINALRDRGARLGSTERSASMAVASAMKSLGAIGGQKRIDGKRTRGYFGVLGRGI